MTNENTDNIMDHCNGEQDTDLNSNNIPGGKQQEPLVEPENPKASTLESMGCASSTDKNETIQKDTREEAQTKLVQTEIDIYFNKEENGGSVRRNNKDGSPKRTNTDDEDVESNKRTKSKTSVQSKSDMDDTENRHQQRRAGPVTRSLASLPKLHVTFEDSDDDDSNYSSWAQRDIEDYRKGYPSARQDRSIHSNLDFYTNKIPSYPDGDYIDNIHKNWFGNYRKLEYHHGYIQWLFPLQERGLNWSAEPLQKHEIQSIKNDKKAMKRVLTSYKLMLNFYGFELVDEKTGDILRLPGDAYEERFDNLNTSPHNYLRITRILKCLGEFDYEYLKFRFLERILYEGIIANTLSKCLRSCKDYWIGTLRSKPERRAIREYARELSEYRRKEITPPSSHHAIRPSTTKRQTEDMKSEENNDDENTSNL